MSFPYAVLYIKIDVIILFLHLTEIGINFCDPIKLPTLSRLSRLEGEVTKLVEAYETNEQWHWFSIALYGWKLFKAN